VYFNSYGGICRNVFDKILSKSKEIKLKSGEQAFEIKEDSLSLLIATFFGNAITIYLPIGTFFTINE